MVASSCIFVLLHLILIGSAVCSNSPSNRQLKSSIDQLKKVFQEEIFDLKLDLEDLWTELSSEKNKTTRLEKPLKETNCETSGDGLTSPVSPIKELGNIQNDMNVMKRGFKDEKKRLIEVTEDLQNAVKYVTTLATNNQVNISTIRASMSGIGLATVEVKNATDLNAGRIQDIHETLIELKANCSVSVKSNGERETVSVNINHESAVNMVEAPTTDNESTVNMIEATTTDHESTVNMIEATTTDPKKKNRDPIRACGLTNIDLVIILDASTSVTQANFDEMLGFANDIVERADIDSGSVRVGIVIYSTKAQVEFYLDTYTTKSEIKSAIARISYIFGSTNSAAALKKMHSDVFNTARGDRRGVDNVAVMITDGISNVNPRMTIPEAQVAHAKGIKVLSIGIGLRDTRELDGMASSPASENSYNVQDFSELAGLVDKLDKLFGGRC